MRVTEAVVISLPERSDRLERLRERQPMGWPFPKLRVVEGVREVPPPWWLSSAGAWGCRQAHLNVLRSAWERGIDTTLVLEDDAVFLPGFSTHWKELNPRIPTVTSMLMLGGQHISAPVPTGDHLVRCVNTRRTHAYIIRLNAIPLLMRTWSTARRHIDHALVEFQSAAKVYAPATFLVGQDAGQSDISGHKNPSVRFWAAGVDS